MVCYGPGTFIRTISGECVVENLRIGDPILTVTHQVIPVKWIGRQTVKTRRSGPNVQPVRILSGALGDGLPHTDLIVTAGHGMLLDGLVIDAGALVNGHSIDWVPIADLKETVTYYHIETEDHDVILANGTPAETFVDVAGRAGFDNYAEYIDLYGVDRIIPEMRCNRITTQRLLPNAIKTRLGIKDTGFDFGEVSVAYSVSRLT